MNSRSFISLLDLFACALGATILLFLIGATRQEASVRPNSNRTILVRCVVVGNTDSDTGNPASIGLEFKKPDSIIWESAENNLDSEQGFCLGSSSPEGDDQICFALFVEPDCGDWEFRPVLLDIPKKNPEINTTVKLFIEGNNLSKPPVNDSIYISQLQKVGIGGVPVKIKVYPN